MINKSQNKGLKQSSLGVCICRQCNYSLPHKRGIPCFTLICPECNIPLVRHVPSENSNKRQYPDTNIKISIFPKIETDLCIGCGACVNECLSGSIHIENGKAILYTEKCIKCRACIDACPVEAIT